MIKRLKRGNRYIWAGFTNNRISTWRFVKGSKLNKLSASELFRNNGTFYRDRVRQETKLTNSREIEYLSKVTPSNQKISNPVRKPNAKSRQFTIKAILKNNKVIRTRSRNLGARESISSVKQAKDEAWENFYRALAAETGAMSDENEGFRRLTSGKYVKNIYAGWVYYQHV